MIDNNTIKEVLQRSFDLSNKLKGSSAIVDLGLPQQINKPIEVQAPVSGGQKRASRPQTAAASNRTKTAQSDRPKSALAKTYDSAKGMYIT